MATGSLALATNKQESLESEDSMSTGSKGKKGWSKHDWDAYLAKLEKEVREGRAPMDLLIRGWEIYACFPDQLTPGSQTAVRAREDSEGKASQYRLPSQEGPEFGDSSPIGLESQVASHPLYQAGLGMVSGSVTSTIINQPVTELRNSTLVGPERQGAWTGQDWEAHLAKLENHEVWFQQAARQVSAQGNAIPFGRNSWESGPGKIGKFILPIWRGMSTKERHQCSY